MSKLDPCKYCIQIPQGQRTTQCLFFGWMGALGSWKHDDIAKQQVFVKSLFADDIIPQLIFLGDGVSVTAFLLYNICIFHYTF